MCENVSRCLCLGVDQRDRERVSENVLDFGFIVLQGWWLRALRLSGTSRTRWLRARPYLSPSLFLSVRVEVEGESLPCCGPPRNPSFRSVPLEYQVHPAGNKTEGSLFQRLTQRGDVGRPAGIDLGSAWLGSERARDSCVRR